MTSENRKQCDNVIGYQPHSRQAVAHWLVKKPSFQKVARLLLVGLILTLCAVHNATAQTVASTPSFDPMCSAEMRSDARLGDVCFVSPTTGWAVGDRGTIWHTGDGGKHWHLQQSGVGCPLHSVWFLDERVGWAAGGSSRPYGHGSSGVLLSTRNGGKNWTRISKSMLPSIHKVRFFDRKVGFALGDASALFPSGVFVTKTGGSDWQGLSGNRPNGWTTGDLIDPTTGALAGCKGTVAAVRRGTINTERSPHFGLRSLRALQLLRPTWGWLAGDGALIMLTGDLGLTWQSTPGELPPGVFENFDFAALAVRGPKCWVAGSPGTRVLRTEDAGRTWTAMATGQNVPLHAMTFVDDTNGWAVGALGTILATNDGGKTWQWQRSGGTRAALLGLFGRSSDVPLELFAQLSGNDGYLGVVEVLNRDDPRMPQRQSVSLKDRLQEAVIRLGASDATVAWRFPLRDDAFDLDDKAVVEDWNQANDGHGLAALKAHLVRQIRLWRPEVVVTHDTSLTSGGSRETLIHQAVLDAVEAAADPTSHVDQITNAGLEPWQVKKVYASQGEVTDAPTRVNEARIAPSLGRTLGEVATDARDLLEERFTDGPETLGFRLALDQTREKIPRDDFFSGIMLSPGGEARRHSVKPPAVDLIALKRIAQKRRNIRAIVQQSKTNPLGGQQLLAQTGELTRGMDDVSAGRVLYHLASQYRQKGKWPLAAETFTALVDRYPNHPLAGESLRWLVQYYASMEAAWRVQGAQRKTTQSVKKPTKSKLSINNAMQEDRPGKAAEFAKRIKRTRPELYAEPAIRFPLTVADRMRGFPAQAERYLLTQRRREERDAWWSCAAGERWLVEPRGEAPKPIVRCVLATEKPRLDSKLDEPCWKQAKGATMMSDPQDNKPAQPAVFKLAYDNEFLYVACQGKHEPGVDYAPGSGTRPRDADLSGHDRVDLLLDINRDYTSYYRLTFDNRGWTHDDCWGDSTWDPTWFVAPEDDGQTWTIEAAIPLDQLTGRYPRSGDVWAFGSQRIIPGVGLQSWSRPASAGIMPQGFGYLVFE